MRNEHCPICGQPAEMALQLRFGKKMHLPTEVELRFCGRDNFLFLAGGSQVDYDQYYASVINDSYHQEVSAGAVRSPIAKLQAHCLIAALGELFATPRKVLDFGCGEASLLIELANHFPLSAFLGFEPGPAANTASNTAKTLGLDNLSIATMQEAHELGPYDLIIASHVMEHLVDFDLLHRLRDSLTESGVLYVEVPDSLHYEDHPRLEFRYYFDRLHVNHFTSQSLARLLAGYGFGNTGHFEYAFPYRDGGEYPALGMLFRKGTAAAEIVAPSLVDGLHRYLGQENERAKAMAGLLRTFPGVIVWGAGDNFYRSMENGGPLSGLCNMVLLDRLPHEVTVGDLRLQTVDPQTGIRSRPWPVVVTISEGRKEISRQITEIDPERRILFI